MLPRNKHQDKPRLNTLKERTERADGMKDTYKEVRTIEFPGMIARVHFPDLTTEERSRRMQYIKDAAEKLLKGVKTR